MERKRFLAPEIDLRRRGMQERWLLDTCPSDDLGTCNHDGLLIICSHG